MRIAHLDPIPPATSVLELQVDDSVELKPYVVAPEMRITSEAKGSRPDEQTTVRADATLDVDVNVSGACN